MILLTGWLRLLSVEAFIVSCSFYKIIIVVLWLPRYIKSWCCLPVRLGKSMRQLDGVLWHISRMSITGEGGGDPCTPGLAPDPGRGALCSHTAHTAVRRSSSSGFVITRIEMGISPAFCCSPPLHTFIHITQVPHPTPEPGSWVTRSFYDKIFALPVCCCVPQWTFVVTGSRSWHMLDTKAAHC